MGLIFRHTARVAAEAQVGGSFFSRLMVIRFHFSESNLFPSLFFFFPFERAPGRSWTSCPEELYLSSPREVTTPVSGASDVLFWRSKILPVLDWHFIRCQSDEFWGLHLIFSFPSLPPWVSLFCYLSLPCLFFIDNSKIWIFFPLLKSAPTCPSPFLFFFFRQSVPSSLPLLKAQVVRSPPISALSKTTALKQLRGSPFPPPPTQSCLCFHAP